VLYRGVRPELNGHRSGLILPSDRPRDAL